MCHPLVSEGIRGAEASPGSPPQAEAALENVITAFLCFALENLV